MDRSWRFGGDHQPWGPALDITYRDATGISSYDPIAILGELSHAEALA